MTETTDDALTDEARKLVADLGGVVADLMLDLHRQLGPIPMEFIVSVAHAQITAMMALHLGGPQAAKHCDRAAGWLRSLPPNYRNLVALARPASGRA